MAGIGMLKDAGDNLVAWWKQEKVSGTIMPIFLILNVAILWTSADWTVTQLIANAFMLILMVWSIWQYRIRVVADNSETRLLNKEKEVEIAEIEGKYKLEHEKLELDRNEFEHKREMERFAKAIVEVEHKKKINLMDERGDFVEEQIEQKVNHILFLTENFELTDKMKEVIAEHKKEIYELRAYKKDLPEKLQLRYRDMQGMNPPKIHTTGGIIENELSAVMSQIKNNTEVKETLNDIKEN